MCLQAQLPFKSKVINFPRRKQETLEQKRAIKVREPGEKRADALVHALNAIRNAKIEKRLDQQSRRREVCCHLVEIVCSTHMWSNVGQAKVCLCPDMRFRIWPVHMSAPVQQDKLHV